MQRIKFEYSLNAFNLVILPLSVVLIIIGIFDLFDDSKLNKVFAATGFIIQTIYFSKMYWYKNYVQWNKKVLMVRLKSFLGHSIILKEIQDVERCDGYLSITKQNGKILTINIKEIEESDITQLTTLLTSYFKSKNK